MWDEEVESNYFYNQRTGEASWIPPDDWRGVDSVSGGGEGYGGGGSGVGGGEDGEWDRYWDDEAGAFYMHNPGTGETRWADADDDAAAQGYDSLDAHQQGDGGSYGGDGFGGESSGGGGGYHGSVDGYGGDGSVDGYGGREYGDDYFGGGSESLATAEPKW